MFWTFVQGCIIAFLRAVISFPLDDNHVRKQRGAEFLMCLAAINRIVEVVKKLVYNWRLPL